jgi:hypothetical protein
MISSVDMLLAKWARWSVRSESRAVGYPGASPMFRDSPSSGVYGSSEPFGTSAGDYQDVTRAVDALPLVLKCCVIEYYLRPGAAVEKAGRLGLKKAVMFKYLHAAHEAIDSYMLSTA